MIKRKVNSLVSVEALVPATLDEFDKLAGKTGACLEEAINNVVYRDWLANWRYHFLHGISAEDLESDRKLDANLRTFSDRAKPIKGFEDVIGVDRKTVPVKGKDGKPKVSENGKPVETFDPEDSEAKFFKRGLAEKGHKDEAYAALGQQIADMILFNPHEAPKSEKGPKKLAAKYLATAEKCIANGNQSKLVALVKKDLNETLVLSGDTKKDAETLGWAIKRHQDWKSEQELASYGAAKK